MRILGDEINRRQFGTLAAGALAGLAFAGCRGAAATGEQSRVTRPTKRPARSGFRRPAAGTQSLGLAEGRDGVLMVPAGASPAPLPLLVLLHGAGGNGGNMLRRLGAATDAAGIAVLAPDSRDARTWDAIRGDLGPDVDFINRALARTFDVLDIDESRLSVGGFSDGASCALTLGLISGDVFGRVVAWSPGFFVDAGENGKARFYISHGRADEILPIERCSRMIVPRLQKRGYDVTYREFDGGHTMPPDIIREGLEFASAPSAAL
jgi:phospholipase/carboxylesterase